jgi:hypothetical protein
MTITATPADGVNIIEVDPDQLAALEREVLDSSGRQRVVPASTYAAHTLATRAALCVKNGIYGLVTRELVDLIDGLIGDRDAIEIGAGDGVLSKALGILGTDNYNMHRPEIRREYERMLQPITKYGLAVRKIDGETAVRKYKPQMIVASWLTHKWTPEQHERGGNPDAPDELMLLANCEWLIFVGNTSAHQHNRLLDIDHMHIENEWMYSRAVRGRNFVGVWKGGNA